MAKFLAALLVLGSAVSIPLFDLAGITFTGDRILGLCAVGAVLGCALRPGLRRTRIHLALGLFVAVQLLTSLFNAGVWPRGMLLVTVYLLGFACFALTAHIAARAEVRRLAVHVLIAVGAAEGLTAALLATAANLSGTRLWGTVQIFGTSADTRVFAGHATVLEANFLGSSLLIPFALLLWASRAGLPSFSSLAGGSLLALLTGIAFSCTRAAWIAMVGIALAWVRTFRPTRAATARLFGAIIVIFALQIATTGVPGFLQRTVLPFVERADATLGPRVSISKVMLRSWWERPLVGHGAGAGSQLALPRGDGRTMQGLWAGNVEVHLLQNSGLLGLAAFLLVVVVVWQEVRREARRRHERWAALGGWAAAGISLLFAFQFTHALWVMFPYVYLGLLTAELQAGPGPGGSGRGSGGAGTQPASKGSVHQRDQ